MMDRALSSTTGRGMSRTIGSQVLADVSDWCIRGHDPIIRNARTFSDHPLRMHGDAVIAGFTELRRLAVSRRESLTYV
jgi:hypothetical protein